MKKIRIGIISPSEIAFRRFLPALKSAEGFEYIGVATAKKEEYSGATSEILDRHRKKALPFMENYGGKIFDGYEKMILSPEIDAVYLPLPPALHFKWAEKALLNNKHVLVEKPSTTCLNDTQKLILLAKEKKLALHEDYMFVFHNQLEAINDIIKSGELGQVRLYRITFGFPRRAAEDFRYNKTLGGGALLDAGGYTMKYASKLLGKSGRLVAATANYLPKFDVDIFGSATMVNNEGITAQLAFGMDNDYKCDLEVWCSKGTLTSSRVLTAPAGFVPTCTIKKNQDYQTRNLPSDDAFLKSIQHFERCIKNETVRIENYEEIEHQENLVEQFRELSKKSLNFQTKICINS
ncbi:MAG: Gfo/Idh/MocA family oxidoreductase [Bacteroidales bacterium]|nr:Gfo/Idh/MocA family oxidoreductase [Bacteroidales bacterium]